MTPTLPQLEPDHLIQAGLPKKAASIVVASVQAVIRQSAALPTQEVWSLVSKACLSPDQPFSLHLLLFNSTYKNWDAAKLGRPPIWSPNLKTAQHTNLGHFMLNFKESMLWQQNRTGDTLQDYLLLHRISVDCPEEYWQAVLKQLGIYFQKRPTRMLQYSSAPDSCRWLPGARFNIADSILQPDISMCPAVVWATEANPHQLHSCSYLELRAQARRTAVALKAIGLRAGDAVALVLPLTLEAVCCYFGVLLMGGRVVSIAESFAPQEMATRMKIANAKAVITQDMIIRGGKTLPLFVRCAKFFPDDITAVVIPGSTPHTGHQVYLRQGDMAWTDFLAHATDYDVQQFESHIADANDTIGVLFSSGTTGEPKAIPWSHVTAIKCAADAWAHQDVRRGDVVCWPTSLGWMMGPWLLYAALVNRATVALYYGAPHSRQFCEFVGAARVTMLGVVPSLVKAWRHADTVQGVDWSNIRCFSSTGEASTPEDYHWLCSRAGYAPVIEYCGGTEIGGAFLTGCLLQPQACSCFSTPTLGTSIALISGEGVISEHGSNEPMTGELAVVAPALGMSQKLMNKDHYDVYYKGMPELSVSHRWLRRHGDEVQRLTNGYYCALGRTDDTMNLGGIKVSSVELEGVCVRGVEGVVEAAAVGANTPGGGPQQLVIFCVLRPGVHKAAHQLKSECQTAISTNLNPLFKVHHVVVAASLPRNAANKVMRRLLREQLKQKAKL